MKSANLWHCNDCRTAGFYYGMSDEEIREKHNKECYPLENPGPLENFSPRVGFLELSETKITYGDYCDYVDFSSIPTKQIKKTWVPGWLWNLVSETVFVVN